MFWVKISFTYYIIVLQMIKTYVKYTLILFLQIADRKRGGGHQPLQFAKHPFFTLSQTILVVLHFSQFCLKSVPPASPRCMAGPMSDAPRNLPPFVPMFLPSVLLLLCLPHSCIKGILHQNTFCCASCSGPDPTLGVQAWGWGTGACE